MIDAIFASTCFISFVAGVSWLGGLVVFAPLHEKTLLFKVRNRFRIADIVSLAILLQVSSGAILALTGQEDWEPRAAMVVVMLIVVTFWWISGLRMLSRAGVENGLHRGMFLTLHLPLGYLCVLGVLSSVVLMPLGIDAMGQQQWQVKLLGGFLFAFPLLSILWGIVCHRICKGMANRARDDQAKRDGIEFADLNESERDPAISQYVVGKQLPQPTNGVWLEEPVVMASVAEEADSNSDGPLEILDETDEEPLDDSNARRGE